MPEFSYEFSWSEIINGVIGSFLFALLGALAVYLWQRWRKYTLLNRNARRKANYVEIWKRIKSKEYFSSCQKTEIVIAVMTFGFMILSIQLHTSETTDGELDIAGAGLILFVLLAAVIAFIALAREHHLNERATQIRIRIERERKKPPRGGIKS